MKAKITGIHDNKYMNIPFAELMDIVFERDGKQKSCSRKAIKALIIRLEHCYPNNGFGNKKTGSINELEAYITGVLILRKGYDA